MNLEKIQIEYKELISSWEFAYAFGHGCSIGDHPKYAAVRERANHLKAIIEEHKSPSTSG